MGKCKFDKREGCSANACFGNRDCNSRDKNGGPMYILTKEEVKMAERAAARNSKRRR